ncbi:MAG: glycosyltransferase family 2 protein, partial [Acidaminococcaceae bacterium]
MPILSIILPVYNAEKLLENTVNSVLQQTFKDFELILVNDGSSDNSLSIANKLADADSRIAVLNKTNGGVCSARNMGLNYSTGKYVGFVDNDDLIEPDMYEVLINDLETYSADVACVRFALLDKGQMEGQKELGCDYLLLNKFEAIDSLCSNGIVSFPCWDKLYLGEIARKTFFNEDLIYTEDYNWVLDYLLQIENIVLRNEIKYIYVQYDDSALHKKMDLRKCLNFISGLYLAYEKCVDNQLSQLAINKAYELYYGKIISLMRQSLIEGEKEIFLKLQQRLKFAVEEMPKDSI